jgi:ABC-type multidrug transport system fused ATPase/permease subunit
VPLGGIGLVGVSFGYEPSHPVLRDIDLTIGAGDHVAILGPNGAGKSTLVSLLLGSHRPDVGVVLIDGIPMDDLDMATIRRNVGLAVQDPVLFAGTIAENIAYAHPDATRDAIVAAARLSTVADLLPTLPAGLDTMVGDEGVRLSGGERQRVALARALLGSPRLVILDEPTTYLDAGAIDHLLDRLEGLPASPTVVTITHDVRVARRAHRIVHLRDGRIEQVEVVDQRLTRPA